MIALEKQQKRIGMNSAYIGRGLDNVKMVYKRMLDGVSFRWDNRGNLEF